MFGKSSEPSRVATDKVVPLPFFDDTPLWRSAVLYSMFVFDDVLNADKLRNSLEALIKLDGFRKLGSRLRRNPKDNSLEYHIPAEFTANRPALDFYHAKHDKNIADHALASRLPKPSTVPAVVANPDDFFPLMKPEGAPTKFEDYIAGDIPQLGLYVVSFKDKTLVSMHWPHTLTDVMGMRVVLDAWTLMLQGRAEEVVPPLYGPEVDPFAGFGENPAEPHKYEKHRLSIFGLAQWGLRNVFGILGPQETRALCIPGPFMAELRQQALADLAADTAEDKPAFLSDSDVLSAWFTKHAILHMPRDSSRTVFVDVAYSLRAPLKDTHLKGPVVSNALAFIPVLLPARDVFSKPLWQIASVFRNAITTRGTPTQVEAFMALWRKAPGRVIPFFGDAGMQFMIYSNWIKARLCEIDLSAAIVDSGTVETTETTPPGVKRGRPSYTQTSQLGIDFPNGFTINRDGEGNFWVSGYMNKGHWGRIAEELTKV